MDGKSLVMFMKEGNINIATGRRGGVGWGFGVGANRRYGDNIFFLLFPLIIIIPTFPTYHHHLFPFPFLLSGFSSSSGFLEF
jgi:hypothetical protein